MSNSTFRVGVVGTGSIGKNHARILAGLPNSKFTAIYDTNAEVARALASQYGAQPVTSLDELAQNGFRIYCIAYLINGFNIYGSSFFTALNNGLISAAISFLRTLVFQLAAVLLLPLLLGINGIWSAVAVAELLTLGLTVTFFVRNRKKYHYA